MEGRQTLVDRRGEIASRAYPFVDGSNTLVRSDRRRTPDRRPYSRELVIPAHFANRQISCILIGYGDDGVRNFSERSSAFLIGRSPQCDVVVLNNFVSREHVRFEYDNDHYVLTDHSTNGTYITIEGNRVLHLLQRKWHIWGSGMISLGLPIEENEDSLIQFICHYT